MDPFTMVVAIVAISVGAGVYTTYLKTRANARADEVTQGEVAKLREDVARLKDRVKTLEAIVTDKDRALSEEIRKLA
ncbi:MAG: hypothetical protein ACK4HR_00915 [Hyphomonas sp.]